jgi:hypothetical protein
MRQAEAGSYSTMQIFNVLMFSVWLTLKFTLTVGRPVNFYSCVKTVMSFPSEHGGRVVGTPASY